MPETNNNITKKCSNLVLKHKTLESTLVLELSAAVLQFLKADILCWITLSQPVSWIVLRKLNLTCQEQLFISITKIP